MENGRNTSGQFTKGHSGFKPKGAVSRKKQKLDQRLNLIYAQLDMQMEESIRELSPRQLIKLYLELTKLVLPKLRRIPYIPDSPVEDEHIEHKKVEFEFIYPGQNKPADRITQYKSDS